MAGAIRIAILANGRQARSEIDKTANSASKTFSKMGSAVKKAAGVGLLVAGAAAVKFGVDSVKAASDAQQSLGATATVFGKFGDTVVKTSDKAARAYGLSANEYRTNANLLGSLLKNQGVGMDELAGKTEGMIGTASDLAATFGGTTSDAVEALGAAFKGEFDSLEKYGISLKQSSVNAEASAIAQQKYGKSLDDLTVKQKTAATQQATSNLIAKQSADAAGAFAKESGTLAHQQQVLGAQVENVQAKIGKALLPILTKAFSYVSNTVIPAVSKFVGEMKNGKGAGGAFADAMGKVKEAFIKAFDAIKPVLNFMVNNKTVVATFAGVILTVVAAVKAWSIAQGILNLVLAANPIGLVVVAIAALAAGFVYAYKKSETFRTIVNKGWELLQKFIGFTPLGMLISNFDTLKSAVSGAVEMVKDLVSWISNIDMGKIGDIAGKIGGIFSRGANGAGAGGKTKAGFGLTGILAGLFNGADREMGDIESNVAADIDALMARITEHYAKEGEKAQDRVHARFEKQRDRLQKKINAAEKTKGKKDEKELQERLDALDGKEEKATNKAIARYNKRAQAAKKAARVITVALQANAMAQDIVNDKIAVATESLQGLQEQAASFAASIRDSFTDFGNVVGLGLRQVGDTSTQTIDDLLADLRAKAAQARAFSARIVSLAAQGLNQATIQQLLAAGPEAGLATADAIAQGGAAAIAEVNSLTADITASGDALGTQMSTTFFGAGISAAQAIIDGLINDPVVGLLALQAKGTQLMIDLGAVLGNTAKAANRDAGNQAGRGFLDGLKDQEDNIERVSTRLARKLAKAVKQQLGFDIGAEDAWVGGSSNSLSIDVRLTSEQIDALSRGRAIQMDLDVYHRAGGQAAA